MRVIRHQRKNLGHCAAILVFFFTVSLVYSGYDVLSEVDCISRDIKYESCDVPDFSLDKKTWGNYNQAIFSSPIFENSFHPFDNFPPALLSPALKSLSLLRC